MLTHLHISDFAIVDRLELDFAAGMTVLTGETGAGKSILLDALGLCLGERAESIAVRHGAERAEVNAGFDIGALPEVNAWLKENELDADGECVIRRVVGSDGRSKAFVNGRVVPVQSLRELGERLVDIHGQHAHQSLLKREVQRELLDGFAGLDATVAELGRRFRAWKALEEEYHRLATAQDERASRLELLRFQLAELQALDLKPGEIAQVEEEHRRLANASRLLESSQLAEQLLYEDDHAAVNLMSRALTELREMERFDGSVAECANLVESALIQAREAASELRHYRDRLDLDPARLGQLEQRLAEIHNLARKHRTEGEELIALAERFATELDTLENAGARLDGLEQDIARARSAYLELARQVSKKRASAAEKLGAAVTANMQELGMAGGRLEVQLETLPEAQAGAAGLERIELLVSANPGQPARPLGKVASGGELSRISLAIQVLTAAGAGIPTLIFDEVDVGIGGRVAEMVGRRLRDLGGKRQVLCVTHQPQVAALGHHHFVVSKQAHKGVTSTRIERVTGDARVEEVARMLGGIEITAQTRSHARELIERVS
ncbi:MAG: DNA repair protein RecN [Thiohalomonadaceae bacterium]